MLESGKLNRTVEISGIKFQIDKDIEIPPNPGGGNPGAVRAMQKNEGKADRASTRNYDGTFEVYSNVGFKSGNYERNGIYIIVK